MNTSTTCKGGALVLLALFGSNAFGQRMEKYTPLPSGTEYVLVQDNGGSFGAGRVEVPVKVVDQAWKGSTLKGFQGPQGTIVTQQEGSWVAILNNEGREVVTWDPPVGYEYPLEPGKTWKRTSNMTMHAQNRTIPVEAQLTVEAFEEVTVPAGTFKAYRIRSINNLGEDTVNWFAPDLGLFVKSRIERSAQHAQGAGTRESELKTISVAR